jgi:hypothetical protein
LKRFLTAVVAFLAIAAGFVALTLPPSHSVLSASFNDGTIPGILHIHSTRSDGRGTIDDIARAAAGAGLKFIVVTDHGDGTRAPDPPAYKDGVLCLDAVEISTAAGHYVALGMPKAPYPLAGEARDVIEDVKRLGGFGIAAHPDSPKPELSWREWTAPFDGIEFANPDTSWRQQIAPAFHNRAMLPTRLLASRIVSYPFRPAESIASLIQPTRILERWADLARRRRVVIIAGADAHARIGLRLGDASSDVTGMSLPIPSYDSMFRSMSVRVRPEQALTGDAVADAALVLRAIRDGQLYTALDGAATPPAFVFTAANASGTVYAGDRLPSAGPVTLHVRSNAPPSFTTAIWNGATLLSGNHHEQDFSVAVPGGAGVYRVEIRSSSPLSVPWITSNPIYVGLPEPSPGTVLRPQASQQQPLLGPAGLTSWHVEHDVTSLAAMDVLATAPGSNGTSGSQARLRFGLSTGAAAGQYAALVVDLMNGLGSNDRVTFKARSDQPMRVSVQLRSDRGRWQRSVYVDTVDQERTVYIEDLTPVGGVGTEVPPRAEIRNILFVVDAINTKPGTSGRVWIVEPKLER